MAGQLDPIWVPSTTDIARARVTAFAEHAARTHGYQGSSHRDLRHWSITKLDDFCNAVWKFFDVQSPSPRRQTRAGTMPHVRWLHGAHLNYVAHLFRGHPAGAVAIIDVQEHPGSQQQTRYLTWAQLRAEAQALNPQAKLPWKNSTTITSPGAAS